MPVDVSSSRCSSIRLPLHEAFVFEAIVCRREEAFVLGDAFLVNDLQECLADIERGRVLIGQRVELRRFFSGELRVRDEVLEHRASGWCNHAGALAFRVPLESIASESV